MRRRPPVPWGAASVVSGRVLLARSAALVVFRVALRVRRSALSCVQAGVVGFQPEDPGDTGEVDAVGDEFADPAEPGDVGVAVPAGAAVGAGRVPGVLCVRRAAGPARSSRPAARRSVMPYTPVVPSLAGRAVGLVGEIAGLAIEFLLDPLARRVASGDIPNLHQRTYISEILWMTVKG